MSHPPLGQNVIWKSSPFTIHFLSFVRVGTDTYLGLPSFSVGAWKSLITNWLRATAWLAGMSALGVFS